MIFTSFKFLFIFLPIVFLGFFVSSKFKYKKSTSLWLLITSFIFYAFWKPEDLVPLIASTLINYGIYKLLLKNHRLSKKYILCIGIAFNLSFLFYYKYISLFLSMFGVSKDTEVIYGIPLGISFYTFTQIASLVDCYRKYYEKNDIINYSLFVSYFPHLICGPILSFKDLYPQLSKANKFSISFENINKFLFCFSIGLFKKIIIADQLAEFVQAVFDAPLGTFFSFQDSVLGALCYSLQLYFDFSGYSDMAVGLSLLFGIVIPDNFNAPYQSTSIIEFWRRWHISLSNFLKNYVYIPLGGSHQGGILQYRNLFITMLLGGLWHGAGWTFVMWGGYHGILLSINHLMRKIHWIPVVLPWRLHKILKTMCTFIAVSLGWVLFRSSSLDQALNIYKSILGLYSTPLPTRIHNTSVTLGLLWVFFLPDTLTLREWFFTKGISSKNLKYGAILCGFMAAYSVLSFNKVQVFLYSGF